MRTLARLISAMALLAVLPATASGAAWGLDGNYGSNGSFLRAEVMGLAGVDGEGRAYRSALNSDLSGDPAAAGVSLTRFTDEGALDTTFGTNGVLHLEGPQPTDGFSLQFDSQDRIYLGWSHCRTDRLLGNGALDETFGTDGHSAAPGACDANDGQRLLRLVSIPGVGDRLVYSSDMALYRTDLAGQLDTSYGTNGVATIPLPQYWVRDARVSDTGSVLAWMRADNFVAPISFARVAADGSFDSGYGQGGLAKLPTWTAHFLQEADFQLNDDGSALATTYASMGHAFNDTALFAIPSSGNASTETALAIDGKTSDEAHLYALDDGKFIMAEGRTYSDSTLNGDSWEVWNLDDPRYEFSVVGSGGEQDSSFNDGETAEMAFTDSIDGNWFVGPESKLYAHMTLLHESPQRTGVARFCPVVENGCDAIDPNALVGTRSNDSLKGSLAADRVSALTGNDRVSTGAAGDFVNGGAGNDVISSGPGADTILGGPGNDVLTPGPSKDTIRAGKGNDNVNSRDGKRDVIDCGSGRDVVRADRFDKVAGNCERVARR